MTLAEVLIAMSLTGMLMALIYPILYGTVRSMLRADSDIQTQQKAMLLVEKFFSDFASTSRSSLTILDSIPAAAFLSQREVTTLGLPDLTPTTEYYPSTGPSYPVVWKKFVVMRYNAAEKTLDRLEFPYNGGSQLACMKPDQLSPLLNDPRYRGSQRVVVSDIDELKLNAMGDSSISLRITSKQRFDIEKTTRIQVVLSMRN